MAKAIRCPNCGKEIPLSGFFGQLGRTKTKRKSRSSRRNLLRAMLKKKWGAPKGNQNWRGRLKKR